MVIVMKPGTRQEVIAELVDRLQEEYGVKIGVIEGMGCSILGLVGDTTNIDMDKLSVDFVLPHEVWTLNEVLTVLSVHGLNMVRLESRPIPEHSWEWLFFLEFSGRLSDKSTVSAINEIILRSVEFRILGHFKSNLD